MFENGPSRFFTVEVHCQMYNDNLFSEIKCNQVSQHHKEVFNRYLKPILSFAFYIDNSLYPLRHRNSSSIFTTELQAIYQCLIKISILPDTLISQKYLLCSDCLFSSQSIDNRQSTLESHKEFKSYHIHSLSFSSNISQLSAF